MSKQNIEPTLCLNMIVKDEEEIIEKTLENLLDNFDFDYYVISDTGSSDNTVKKIEQFFNKNNISGEIYHDEWRNFGYNRTKALEHAYNKTDFIMIFDADDSIQKSYEGKFRQKLTKNIDSYELIFGNSFTYKRPLIINNNYRWKFIGVLHEYLVCKEKDKKIKTKTIERTKYNDYYLISGKFGNRSKSKVKYHKDAVILEDAIKQETNKYLKNRYIFYLAQSYKDCKLYERAIKNYEIIMKNNMCWNQERYYSALTIGNIYYAKKDYPNAIKYWSNTVKYDNTRMEGIVKIIEHYYNQGNHLLVSALCYKYENYSDNISNKLFVEKKYYLSLLEYYQSISSFYTNEPTIGYSAIRTILSKNNMNKSFMTRTILNMNFYYDIFMNDTIENKMSLLKDLDSVMKKICDINYRKNIESKEYYDMAKIYDKFIKGASNELSSYKSYENSEVINTNTENKIMFSMTTCKRYDLFEKTINSFLKCCLDKNLISDWFIVDDNSSLHDRELMKKKYKFINFYHKTLDEIGHRNSMNIIYERLKQKQPKYWIHLEDDFLFYISNNYITKSIHLIENNNSNISQIVFNRNYAETPKDYHIQSHINLTNNDYCLHEHKIGNYSYKNCHYWYGYSFRPSLIKVDTILKLGNYDSPNTFFEHDYSKKYYESKYRTGFLNNISSRHIGKLTSETGINAYTLNKQEQFNINTKNKNNNNGLIRIVNLERRNDRKLKLIEEMKEHGIKENKYIFKNAVDGSNLYPSKYLSQLFDKNDFNSRTGIMGCALSHYNLWQELLDGEEDYYLIMEDDCKLCDNFDKKINEINFEKYPIMFLGYSMYSIDRTEKYLSKNDKTNIELLDILLQY